MFIVQFHDSSLKEFYRKWSYSLIPWSVLATNLLHLFLSSAIRAAPLTSWPHNSSISLNPSSWHIPGCWLPSTTPSINVMRSQSSGTSVMTGKATKRWYLPSVAVDISSFPTENHETEMSTGPLCYRAVGRWCWLDPTVTVSDMRYGTVQCVSVRYLRYTLDRYVENDYTVVYFHFGLCSANKPSVSWLKRAYNEFDRK